VKVNVFAVIISPTNSPTQPAKYIQSQENNVKETLDRTLLNDILLTWNMGFPGFV